MYNKSFEKLVLSVNHLHWCWPQPTETDCLLLLI